MQKSFGPIGAFPMHLFGMCSTRDRLSSYVTFPNGFHVACVGTGYSSKDNCNFPCSQAFVN